MKLHNCPANPKLLAPPPALDRVRVQVKPTTGKANIDLSTGVVEMDPTFLRSLDEDGAMAALFHETAHKELGLDNHCERCADNRVGACLAMSGFTEDRAKRALDSLGIRSRKTMTSDAVAGFKAAVTSTKRTSGGNRPPPPTQSQAPSPSPAKEKDPFFGPPMFTPIDEKPAATDEKQPDKPVDSVDPLPDDTTIPSLPSETPSNASCACESACTYDYGYVIGIAGALLSIGIVLTQWAYSK